MTSIRTTRLELPADPQFLRRVGTLLASRHDWRLLAALQEARLEEEPDNWRLWIQLYESRLSQGDRDRAAGVLERLLTRAAMRAGSLTQVERMLHDGQHQDALLEVARWRHRVAAKDWRKTVAYAAALLDAGRVAEARTLVSALLAEPGRATSSRKLILARILDEGASQLIEAALAGWLDRDPKGLGLLVSVPDSPDTAQQLLAALSRLEHERHDTFALQLSVIRAMDELGDGAKAQYEYQIRESRIEKEARPSRPSPTASTMMYRNLPLLHQLVETIAWMAEDSGRTVSVHVAACSSGEEPYSLAMALIEAGLDAQCRLCASDVSRPLVEKAKRALIHRKSLANVPDDLVERYLRPGPGDAMELVSRARALVEFDVADISRDVLQGAPIDLLVANNVLVHFPDDQAAAMLRSLVGQLADNGVLCIGGGWHAGLQDMLEALGLQPIVAGSHDVLSAWKLQRRAWYISPRPYWALPPACSSGSGAWKHAALFTRSERVRNALEHRVSSETGP